MHVLLTLRPWRDGAAWCSHLSILILLCLEFTIKLRNLSNLGSMKADSITYIKVIAFVIAAVESPSGNGNSVYVATHDAIL